MLGREALALSQRLHQRGVQRAAGHSHRAVDDAHILRLCRQQHILVGLGGVALVGGDKAGSKLHTRSAKLCKVCHVGTGVHAARHKYRDGVAVLFLVRLYLGQHPGQNLVQGLAAVGQQVLLGKAEMPARLAALDDHKVCGAAKAAAQTQRDTLYARTAAFLARRRQHYTGPQADALTPDELQTALQAQHDSLRRGLAEVHDRMANAESRKKDLEKLTRQKAQLQAQRPDQANAVEQARTAQANAEKAAAEAQTRLAEGQKNLPWPDAAAMAAARAETQKQRRTLQAALDAAAKSRDAFSKELAAAQSAAQTLAEQAGDTASRPDPAAQQQALTALQAERKNLRDQNQAALHRLDTNRDALTNLKKAITAAESARANAAMLDNLSKTINGNLTQKQKLPFEQYVQSFYFDGVVAAANRRFTRMTGGQYTLRRRQSADIAAKTALELDVFDAYTGKTRPVGSLSGGESFLAALSLALGISDTIQESAGGISVDTLFVDEGFGTLDADALQKAIDTLTALAGSDKLVGIISHVETLQDRIPKQILVQKTKCGSKAQVELG